MLLPKTDIEYLLDNLAGQLQVLNRITLYILIGTCDLTYTEDDFIFLKSRDLVDNLVVDLR